MLAGDMEQIEVNNNTTIRELEDRFRVNGPNPVFTILNDDGSFIRLENYKTIGDYGIQSGQEINLFMADQMEHYCVPTNFEEIAKQDNAFYNVNLSTAGLVQGMVYTFRITPLDI
jgi:hypothetical protein